MKRLALIAALIVLAVPQARAAVNGVSADHSKGVVLLGSPAGAANCKAATTGAIRYNSTTPRIEFCNGSVWASVGSAGSIALNALTAATAAHTINSAANAQEWDWNSLTTGNGMTLGSTSVTTGSILYLSSAGTAAGASQTGLNITLSGANAGSNLTTYGAHISNTHSTHGSTNVGLYATATGGATANYAGIFDQGNVGIGTTAPGFALQVIGPSSPTTTVDINGGPDNYGTLAVGGVVAIGKGGSEVGYLKLYSTSGRYAAIGMDNTNDTTIVNTYGNINITPSANTIFTAGNVGIGTTSPTLAPLQVAGMVGNTAAMFGSGSTGISLIANYPEIGFNEYYNGGPLFMGTGYAGDIEVNIGTGDMAFDVSTASGSAGGAVSWETPLVLDKGGNARVSGEASASQFTTYGNSVSNLHPSTVSSEYLYTGDNDGAFYWEDAADTLADFGITQAGGVGVSPVLGAGINFYPDIDVIDNGGTASLVQSIYSGGTAFFHTNSQNAFIWGERSYSVPTTHYFDNFAPLMVLTGQGFLGVGTATPWATVSVSSPNNNSVVSVDNEVGHNSMVEAYTNGGYTYTGLQSVGNSATLYLSNNAPGGEEAIYFGNDLNTYALQIGTSGSTGWSAGAGYIWQNTGDLVIGGTAGAGMYFATSTTGNVGIDTESPQSNLQIGGQSRSSTATPVTLSLGGTYSNTAGAHPKLKLYDDGTYIAGFGVSGNSLDSMVWSGGNYNWYAGGTDEMTLNSSGHLGINTTTPNAGLEVYYGTNYFTSGTTNYGIYSATSSENPGVYSYSVYGHATSGNNSTGFGVYGDNTTGFGAGVYGNSTTVNAYGGYFTNSGGGYALIVPSGSGNVGIGTSTPGYTLDVAGTVKLGSTGTAITAMGVCTVASYTPTNTAANKTCTGVPASSSVAVNCSPSAAFQTPNTTVINVRATGTADQIAVNLSAANNVAVTLTCMWVKP